MVAAAVSRVLTCFDFMQMLHCLASGCNTLHASIQSRKQAASSLQTVHYLIKANHPKKVYRSSKGYIANAFLAGDTDPAIKGTEAHELQANATKTTIHRAMMFVTQTVTIAATSNGNMQYPRRHMDWKNPMLPPSSITLHVRTTAPNVRLANTSCTANTTQVSVSAAAARNSSVQNHHGKACLVKTHRKNTARLLRPC